MTKTLPKHWPSREIVEKRTADLVPFARNARLHSEEQVAQIARSIEEWGWTMPVLVDMGDVLIAGHGRVMAAEKLGIEKVPAMVARGWSQQQCDAYRIADNQLALTSEWDEEALAEELERLCAQDVDLSILGFAENKLEDLLGEIDRRSQIRPAVDSSSESRARLQQKWGTAVGQHWRIGRHSLVIDDCASVSMPRGGGLFFDPPWQHIAEAYVPEHDAMLAFADGQRQRDVIERFGAPTWIFAWDCVTSWFTPGRPLRRAKHCLWFGDIDDYDGDGSHYGDAGEPRRVVNTRGSYDFTPDPRGKHLSDIYQEPITQLHSEQEHSHSKPIDWVRMLIANCLRSSVVLDPYSGSCVSMVACEQIGKTCFAVEISPEWAAVGLESMSTLGCSPVREPPNP